MKIQLNTILALGAIIGLAGYIGYDAFPQQIAVATGEQKIFRHAPDLLQAIDEAEYTDNTPVMADPSAISSVTIENWDDIKTLDKIAINTNAALNGYVEVTP